MTLRLHVQQYKSSIVMDSVSKIGIQNSILDELQQKLNEPKLKE